MNKGKMLHVVGLVVLFCCVSYTAEPQNERLAKDMRKAVMERLSARDLNKSKQQKIVQAWERVIRKAVSKTDVRRLDSDERKRVMKHFSEYLTFGDVTNVSGSAEQDLKEQIRGGLHCVVSGKGLLKPEELAKITDNMENYKRRCSDILLEYVQKADRFAMRKGRWSAIKSAYRQAAMRHWGSGYSMTEDEQKTFDHLTTERKSLRWRYAELFIYTQIMRAFCNRVSTDVAYTSNIFLQHMVVDSLNQEQIQTAIEGIPDMDKRIRLQLDNLLSGGTFYFTGPPGLAGYWGVALAPENELVERTRVEPKDTDDWLIIEKARHNSDSQNGQRK
ncbi:MAG: hypothetical protein ACLFWL_18585 [Candidatus Brocadiia bacterium]|nr:hypothetical protein [Planctomycetota bacterium]